MDSSREKQVEEPPVGSYFVSAYPPFSCWAVVLVMLLIFGSCDDAPRDASPDDVRRLVQTADRIRDKLGEEYDAPIAPGTSSQLVRGARLYSRLCASCHGTDGKGDGWAADRLTIPPGDLTDPARAAILSDQGRLHVLRKGIEGSPMIGWEGMLGESDLRCVLHYVRSLVATEPDG